MRKEKGGRNDSAEQMTLVWEAARATVPLPLETRMEQAAEPARASQSQHLWGRMKFLCVKTERTDFLAGPRQTSQPCRETEL